MASTWIGPSSEWGRRRREARRTPSPGREAVIVGAVRTPSGRQNGVLAGIEPCDLLGWVQTAALERAGIDPGDVDQVIAGCGRGGEHDNIGRLAWLAGGLPPAVPAMTLDSPSGSSLHAAGVLAHLVAAGAVDVGLACGVEVMSSAGPDPAVAGGAQEQVVVRPASG